LDNEINKLKENIATLEEVYPESSKLATLKKKLAALEAKSGATTFEDEDIFETDMTDEELAEVATGFSNRPVAGEYAAVLGKPDREYSEAAIKIPFTILEKGQWEGFTGDAFYPGKSKAAAFSIKNICESAGVKSQVNPRSRKAFYPISQLEGKKLTVVYKDRTSMFVGNDNVEREVTKAKVAHAKPYYDKPRA